MEDNSLVLAKNAYYVEIPSPTNKAILKHIMQCRKTYPLCRVFLC